LCNTHVERGAYIIAFIGALLSAIFAVLQLLSGNIPAFIIGLFSFLIYWSILYAQRKRSPGLYWPFLFLNGISILLMGMYIVFLIAMLILLPPFWANERHAEAHPDHRSREALLAAVRLFTWLQLIYTIIAEIITIFFWSIVYRAYVFMKEELAAPTILRKV